LFQQCSSPVKPAATEIPFNKDSAQAHYISLKDAEQLTANFRRGEAELARQLKDTGYLQKNFNLPIAGEFNRDAIAVLLNHKGAEGIRIYLAQDDKGIVKFVLVGVDGQGKDITGPPNSKEEFLLDATLRCPTMCSFDSALMKRPAASN
jgi:hypothetical protein